MKVVNIHEAEMQLSRLIQEAIDGEEIVIASDNEPLVRLVLVESARSQRTLGWAKRQVTMAADFDAPLDDFADDRSRALLARHACLPLVIDR